MKRAAIILVPLSLAFAVSGIALGAAGVKQASTVKVVLAPGGDYTKLKPSTSVAKAGQVTFVVTNQSNLAHGSTYGVKNVPEGHELVVLRTNLPPGKLRIDKATGNAVETGRVGKPLPLDPGKTGTITLTLKPGNYVLICNFQGHYATGQYAAFKVTG